MSENSSIEWTTHTFNPWLGCAKAHAGCTHCYAEKHQAVKMRKGGEVTWGEVWQGGKRVVVSQSTWGRPLSWARTAARGGERERVFCASLADVLEVPQHPASWPRGWSDGQVANASLEVVTARDELNAARSRLWDVIRETSVIESVTTVGMPHWAQLPGLDWLLLTKRPENWRLIPEDVRPLVWLGTSISDQKTADEWVPRLIEAEGVRYRFLSVEPLLGPVDLTRLLTHRHPGTPGLATAPAHSRRSIDWVIVGGESGPKARPCNVEWIRDIVRQCREAGVPCFVKQDSGPRSGMQGRLDAETWAVKEFPR